MKKLIFTLIAMVTMTISAQAMTFRQAQQEALFLSDKMAYELNLSNQQYEAVYEINLNYMLALSVNDDIFGYYWERRNEELSFVLSTYQYRNYMVREYFYRPVYWQQNGFVFRIYTNYTNRHQYYFSRPSHFNTYRGNPNWHSRDSRSVYQGRVFDRDHNPPAYVDRRPQGSSSRYYPDRNMNNRGNAPAVRNNNSRGNAPSVRDNNNQRRNWHSNNNSNNRPSRR